MELGTRTVKKMQSYCIIFALISILTSCIDNTKSKFADEHRPLISDYESGTPADQLSFSVNPSTSGNTDTPLSIQPVVLAENTLGATLQDFTYSINLEAYSDSSCTTLVPNGLLNAKKRAVAGVATFTDLKIIKTSVIAIRAKFNSVNSACISGLTISPGSISSLRFSQDFSPLTIVAGVNFTTQPIVTALDSNENIVTTDSTSNLTLVAYSGNNCSGSTIASALSGTLTQTLVNGESSFIGISVEKSATKSIRAIMGMITGCSSNLSISSGTISDSNSTISSTTNVTANGTTGATVTITLKDAFGNFISGVTPVINVSGTNNTVSTCSISSSIGVSTCTIKSTKAQSKTITITSPSGITSSATSVFLPGVIASLSFAQAIAPLTLTAGDLFSIQPLIYALDANSNIVTTDSTSNVTLSAYNANNCSGSAITSGIAGTPLKTLVSGVATYTDIAPANVLAKSIRVQLGSLSVCSSNFTVSAGIAADTYSTIVATSNINADGSATASITTTLKDAYNNSLSNLTPSLNVTGSNNTLSSCSLSNSNGVSTCTLSSTKAETKVITFTTPSGLTVSGTSTFIGVTPTSANSTILLQAGTADDSTPISVTITLKDANNNAVPNITPAYELLDSRGTYTVVTACPATNSSGVSVCTFKTWRGKERVVRISSPTGLTSVTTRATLGCSLSTFFNGAEGSGSIGSPYLISTPKQLDQIRCSSQNYFKLVNDIDLANYDWLTNNYITSVSIDGNNKTISNLSIDLDISDYAAAGSSIKLASFLQSSSGWSGAFREVKDLTFRNSRVVASGKDIGSNGTEAATLCASCIYKFSNIHVIDGVVEGSDDVAGIVINLNTVSNGSGTSSFAELTNSSFKGSVSFIATSATGNKYRWSLAGLVGSVGAGGAIVSNNTFEGTVDSSILSSNNGHVMGGIIGEIKINENSTTTPPVFENNTVTNSTLQGRYSSGGGIVGKFNLYRDSQQITMRNNTVRNTDIQNSQTSWSEVGGIIGLIKIANSSDSGSFLNKELLFQKNSATETTITSMSEYVSLGGLVGKGTVINMTDNYVYDFEFTTINDSSNRTLGGLVGSVDSISSALPSNVKASASRNYAAVSVNSWNSSNNYVKGLVGRKSNTAGYDFDLSSDDNYFDTTTSALTEVSPFTDNGLSTTAIQNTQFSGWNNTSVWLFQANQYPTLR